MAKELFWAKGSDDYEALKAAFLNHGVKVPEDKKLWLKDYIYYGCEGEEVKWTSDTYEDLVGVITKTGTHLCPEEHFEPFDKVIALDKDGCGWFVDFYSGEENGTICGTCEEMHHYEPWMKKYIGTFTDFKDWERPTD